jgi:hypothetical protein
VATLAFGAALAIVPERLLALAALPPQPTFFVRLAGLMVALVGGAYTAALVDRATSRSVIALGVVQKAAVAGLFAAFVATGGLPPVFWYLAAFDGAMAVLFFVHLRGSRTDGWV